MNFYERIIKLNKIWGIKSQIEFPHKLIFNYSDFFFLNLIILKS